LFHPLSLQGLSDWRFLRAMDWMHTNNSSITSWRQRTNYRHQNQVESVHGLAFEYLVSLANVVGSDLWINIPHRVDDNYVTNLAVYIRNNLHPALKVYVEYSNELWNNAFPFTQGAWVESQGMALYPSALKFDARLQYQSDRAMRIADIFKSVFTSGGSRVINVIAGQAANTYTGDKLLSWRDAYTHLDAYAIAPYFGGELAGDPAVASCSLDRLFDRINTTAVMTQVAPYAQLASSKGVRLIDYEAGQHLVGDASFAQLFISANRDARMGTSTSNYLEGLKANGINEVGYYSDTSVFRRYGSWGARESQTQLNVPKLNALYSFNESRPCWWPVVRTLDKTCNR
jgi:hypothetical protein